MGKTRAGKEESGISDSVRGRPRDPGLEGRVYDAAIALYAEGGWSRLTFDAVARASGVGKSSLYRRWDTREELFRSALDACWLPVRTIDTGSIRDDLRELADMILTTHTGRFANLKNWFLIDAQVFPELRDLLEPYMTDAVLQGRAIVRRAIQRQELPDTVNPGLVMDLIVGAVNNHVMTTPAHLKEQMIRKAPGFLDDLIDVVLQGIA